jgi:predicted lipoprotein with Yx(FWY)xxD motif
MRTRKRLFAWMAVIVVLAAAGAVLAADYTIDAKTKDGIGSYLVDAKGMTLYYFKNDSPGKSACAGPCVEKWPIFYAETVTPSPKLAVKDFGTITRDDGKMQTTYKGMPLYYFSGDKDAGDTKGHGVKGVWSVVKP